LGDFYDYNLSVDLRTDAALVALARRGDKNSFGELLARYQPLARQVALGFIRDEELAGELAQEAMLQAYLSLDHLRDDARFASWLYGIVLNVCRTHVRNQKATYLWLDAVFDSLPFSGMLPTPQEVAEERELHTMVQRAINALSPQNRAATLLFYYDELSLQEIAARLGISISAVKGRLHKSRKQLR
jgi:RNA polymerase sigma factor (sigma-70 family)